MIDITIDNEHLDLPSGFSIEITETSPAFNDVGSQSIPATVPATDRNNRIMKFPARTDAGERLENKTCTVQSGAFRKSGRLNIISASPSDGIEFNIGFDSATAYETWSNTKLNALKSLPVIKATSVSKLVDKLDYLYRFADSQKDDLALFPVILSVSDKRDCDEILNQVKDYDIVTPSTVSRMIDGTVTSVKVPDGYGISPFVRVWRVLELIFENLGYEIAYNPFRQNIELSRLVVLNNTADACCTGTLDYRDLLPDVTVEAFLNSLYVRFGLIVHLDHDRRVADLQLLDDLLSAPEMDNRALTEYLSAPPKINYLAAQYVTLTAQCSIDGAKPASPRFEDFIAGQDLDDLNLRYGSDVAGWSWNESRDDFEYDWPDYNIDDYEPGEMPEPPEPEWPDPDDDRDDGRDDDGRDDDRDDGYDARMAPSRATGAAQSPGRLAFEAPTCMWYKTDRTNGCTRVSSSSFFDWDPATVGLEPLNLSSDDEWVPIDSSYYNRPMYLFGSRHNHTYIRGNDTADNTGDDSSETPLAFLFAFTDSVQRPRQTFGHFSPLWNRYQYVTFNDGTEHRLSLLFQFGNGLFARFWSRYDEILRHGNRSIEAKLRMDRATMSNLNIIAPLNLHGHRCMIDSMNYSLPASLTVPVDITLRSVMTQGIYDINAEQNIPRFAILDPESNPLEWVEEKNTMRDEANSSSNLLTAMNRWYDLHPEDMIQADSDYPPHKAELYDVVASRSTWKNDSDLKNGPININQRVIRSYFCYARYTIYPVIYEDYTDRDSGEIDYDNPRGTIDMTLIYSVTVHAALKQSSFATDKR